MASSVRAPACHRDGALPCPLPATGTAVRRTEGRQPKGGLERAPGRLGICCRVHEVSHPTASQCQRQRHPLVPVPSSAPTCTGCPTQPPEQPPSLLESTRSKITNNHARVVFFGVSENQSHARARGRRTHRTRGQDLSLGWAPRLAQPYPSAREPQGEPQPAPAPGVPASGRLSLQQRLGSGFITASSLHRPHYSIPITASSQGPPGQEPEGKSKRATHSRAFKAAPQANSSQGSRPVWLPASSGLSQRQSRGLGTRLREGGLPPSMSTVLSQNQGSQPRAGRGTRPPPHTGGGSRVPSQDTATLPPALERGQGSGKRPWTQHETWGAAPQAGSDVPNLGVEAQGLYGQFTHNSSL